MKIVLRERFNCLFVIKTLTKMLHYLINLDSFNKIILRTTKNNLPTFLSVNFTGKAMMMFVSL
jgi:hypothetical protein